MTRAAFRPDPLLDDSRTGGSSERDERVDVGLQLACTVQVALPGVDIHYRGDGDRRSVSERRGR